MICGLVVAFEAWIVAFTAPEFESYDIQRGRIMHAPSLVIHQLAMHALRCHAHNLTGCSIETKPLRIPAVGSQKKLCPAIVAITGQFGGGWGI